MTPADADGLRAIFAEAHQRFTAAVNARFRWTGHLFQGRFGAVVMAHPITLLFLVGRTNAWAKGRDEMVIARGIHGGIGGDNGCRRCRNSSVSMVKSQ